MGLGGGSSAPQVTSQTTVQELSPEQRAIIKPLIPVFTKFGQTPLEQFPRSVVPGFTRFEKQAQAGAVKTARGLGSSINQAQSFQDFLFSPELFQQAGRVAQPAIDAALRPLERAFTESILPNIRNSEGLAGQVGGSRGRLAEQGAVKSFLTEAGDISADIVNKNFSEALSASSRALFTAPQTFQSALLPSQILSSVGGAQRQLSQAQLLEKSQRFGAEQLLAFEPARAAAGVAFGIPGGTVNTTSTSPGAQGPSFLQTALGIAGIGASLFGPGFASGLLPF